MGKPEVENHWPERLLFIGCGNMAGAILARWLDCGLPPYRVHVVRPSGAFSGEGVDVSKKLDEPVTAGTWIVLGVKPQQLAQVAQEIAPYLDSHPRILSLLAGVSVDSLDVYFPQATTIVRCMPNLPVRTGEGVALFYPGRGLSDRQRADITRTCGLLGLVEWLNDEALFNAATALSGCGPAFVYRFVDALKDAGVALGLDPDMAARMAKATVTGAGAYLSGSEASATEMADAVASKGGMTREGLNVLDHDGALERLIEQTLRAASERGEELGKLADLPH